MEQVEAREVATQAVEAVIDAVVNQEMRDSALRVIEVGSRRVIDNATTLAEGGVVPVADVIDKQAELVVLMARAAANDPEVMDVIEPKEAS